MRQRKPRDREMTADELAEWQARIDADKARAEAERQREEQRKAAIVAAEWME